MGALDLKRIPLDRLRKSLGRETGDREWCSVFGYDIPEKHVCIVGICYNPYKDEPITDICDKPSESRKQRAAGGQSPRRPLS